MTTKTALIMCQQLHSTLPGALPYLTFGVSSPNNSDEAMYIGPLCIPDVTKITLSSMRL